MKTHYIITDTRKHNIFACGLVHHKSRFNGKEKISDVTCKNCIRVMEIVYWKQMREDSIEYDKVRM